MRLTRRLDSLARRLPDASASREDIISRAVFARYRQETDAARTATPHIDYDAYNDEFERVCRETPDFLEQMEAFFAEAMRAEEAAYGPWMTILGHGRIRERTYARLRAQVAGGWNATESTAQCPRTAAPTEEGGR